MEKTKEMMDKTKEMLEEQNRRQELKIDKLLAKQREMMENHHENNRKFL